MIFKHNVQNHAKIHLDDKMTMNNIFFFELRLKLKP